MRLLTLFVAVSFCIIHAGVADSNAPTGPAGAIKNIPHMVEADGRLRLNFGEERLVLPRGLQPSMLATKSGALVVQAQVPEKTFPTTRMVALDTYIMPGARPGEGIGQLYTSKDDWHTLEGPQDVSFELPGANFYASKDDGGHPHDAQRLHRRILEMPNGDLLTTIYGWMQGDNTPATYQPRMKKSRLMVVRSNGRGQHWKLISHLATEPPAGTEGLCEPVLAHVSKGPNAGRLLCLMRTGRELYETISDDEGATWSPPQPRVFAGLDIFRTELWVDELRSIKDSKGRPLDESNPDELRGAVVDPDLVELRSGLLVAAFGVRVPQKSCWQHPDHPWNGNYLAFSRDHGQTWSNVVRLTSGVLTTHYMAIEETPTDNKQFVTYDLGAWGKMRRDVYGRFVEVTTK